MLLREHVLENLTSQHSLLLSLAMSQSQSLFQEPREYNNLPHRADITLFDNKVPFVFYPLLRPSFQDPHPIL
jgi:hypothetical protein